MNAVKGSWIGQTFALAKCNDSGGKKSRVRRSKEERKAMTESFIKRYQESNNGNFPSLNLTHKEVGGSFYTVREIVREIIQENRVLGPAKLTSEEENSSQFIEQYPLGSISREPQLQLPSFSMGAHFVTNHHPCIVINGFEAIEKVDESEQQLKRSKNLKEGKIGEPDQSTYTEVQEGKNLNLERLEGSDKINYISELPDNENLKGEKDVEGSTANTTYVRADYTELKQYQNLKGEKIEESDQTIHSELRESELSKAEENVEESTAKVTQIPTDIVVETFPLRSVNKPSLSLDGSSHEARDVNGTLDRLSCEENSVYFVGEKVLATIPDASVDNSLDCSESREESLETRQEVSGKDVLTLESTEPTESITKIEPIVSSNCIHDKNLNGSKGSISRDSSGLQNNSGDELSPQKGSDPTLDRINLESWGGASKKLGKAKANPLLGFFKALVDAFVKFWTE